MNNGRVDQLLELRKALAAKARCVAERELDARLLRLNIEAELVQQGVTKTEAEKRAKADARYLTHETASIRIAYERDLLLAEAEALRFGILLDLADVEEVPS